MMMMMMRVMMMLVMSLVMAGAITKLWRAAS